MSLASTPAVAQGETLVANGAYIHSAPQDPTQIDAFASLTGKQPSIVMWYQHWGDSADEAFNTQWLNDVSTRGAMPIITWEPWNSQAGTKQPLYALKKIAAGYHDTYIKSWARGAKAYGRPFYLRFAYEMNGNWYPWCVGVNGNTSAHYVAAYRHVVEIFRQEGVTNVRFVWSPNIEYDGSTPLADLYPGDTYVDWVGMDGYNWGATEQWHTWQDLKEVFSATYDKLANSQGGIAPNKPLMIAETASTEVGGDKRAWIRQGFLTDLPTRFPKVQAVVWFNEDKETDWRVNSSASSLEAYKEVVANSYYQGRLPP